MNVGAPIDDTYAIAMDLDFLGTMVVDVVSRYGIRTLLLNMEHGQVMWRWDEDFVKVIRFTKQTMDTASTKQKRKCAWV